MAKKNKFAAEDEVEVTEAPTTQKEMTLEEAKAYRASLAPSKADEPMNESERREEFRKYWAQNKANFGAGKDLEPIIWVHLKAIGMDHPKNFDQGLKHFGLKKVK